MPDIRLAVSIDEKGTITGIKQIVGGLDDLDKKAKKTSDTLKGQLSKAMGSELNTAAESAAGRLGKLGGVLSSVGPAGLVAAAGIGAVVAAVNATVGVLAQATRAAADYADQVITIQERSGASAAAIQEWMHGAALGGITIEEITGAVSKMQRALVEAPKDFARLGLSAKALRDMAPQDALQAIADQINRIPDATGQAAAAMDIFGKSGASLLPFLRNMRETSKEARDLGLVMSDDMLKGSKDLADGMVKLERTWSNLWKQIGGNIATSPQVQQAFEDITKAVAKLTNFITQNFDKLTLLARIMAGMATFGASETVIAALSGGAGPVGAAPPAGGVGYRNNAGDLQAFPATSGRRLESVSLSRADLARGPFKVPPLVYRGAAEEAAAAAAAKAYRKQLDAAVAVALAMPAGSLGAVFSKTIDTALTGLAQRNISLSLPSLGTSRTPYVNPLGGPTVRNPFGRASYSNPDFETSFSTGELGVVRDLPAIEKATTSWDEQLQRLANTMQLLGGNTGRLGSVMNKLAGVVGGISSIGSSLKDLGVGGGTSKFLGQLGAVGSIAAAGIGIFGSLFGGGKRKREEEKQKRQQAEQDAISSLENLSQRWETFRTETLQRGVSGLTDIFGALADRTDLSAARLARLGVIGAAVFGSLTASGMSFVDAAKQFQAAGGAAGKMGVGIDPGTGGKNGINNLSAFSQKVTENEGLVRGAEGLAGVTDALRVTGSLTQETFNALQAEVGAFKADLEGVGFTGAESLAIVAKSLFGIQEEAKKGRVQVDAGTQALIDQANSAGLFDGLKDPMAEMVEIQKLMLEATAALAKVFGADLPASVQRYIDSLNQIPTNIPGPPGGGGGGDGVTPGTPRPTTVDPDFTSAAGFGPRRLERDTVFQAHAGEHVLIVPAGRKVGFKSARRGYAEWDSFDFEAAREERIAQQQAALAGSSSPSPETTVQLEAVTSAVGQTQAQLGELTAAVTSLATQLPALIEESGGDTVILNNNPTIAPQVDPKGIKRNHEDFMAEVESTIADAVRLGNSPLLRALEQRYGDRLTGRR